MDNDDLAHQIYELWQKHDEGSRERELYRTVADPGKASKIGGALLFMSYSDIEDFNTWDVYSFLKEGKHFDKYPELDDVELFLEGVDELGFLEAKGMAYKVGGPPFTNYARSYGKEDQEALLEAGELARTQLNTEHSAAMVFDYKG